MNYIKIINQFWTSIESELYQTSDIALYFYLLKVSNDASWCNPFKRNNRRIEADLNISYRTLCNARNKLKQSGFIDFTANNGNPNVTYTLYFKDEVTNEVGNEVGDEVRSRLVTSKDKLKLNKKNTPPISPTQGESPSWKTDFEIYKKELRAAYQSAIADKKWIKQREEYHPNLNVLLSIKKACADYWATEEGWKYKRHAKTNAINWRSTFNTALTVKSNQVYKQRQNPQTNENEVF